MKKKIWFAIVFLLVFTASRTWVVNNQLARAEGGGYTQPSGLVGYWNFDQISATTATDGSGLNNHGTVHGTFSTSGKINGALFFDGTDDYVDCGNSETLDPTQAATIEAWINFDILPSDAGHIMEIASRSGGGTDLDLQAETDNRIKFFVGPGGPNVAISTTVVEIDKWYHVAATYQGGNNIKIYINSALEKTTPTSITRNPNSNSFSIGQSMAWPGRFFEGKIDEVKIYNRALSEEEIEAEYISISISPSSKTMNVGESQQFTSSISGGTSPYTYQWYLNSAPVSGATGSLWTYTAGTTGSYAIYASVHDAAGALETSNTATVTVTQPPSTPTVITNVTVSNNSATVDQSNTTGVSITVTGPSLQDGTQLNITSSNYGEKQPEGTGEVSVDEPFFYFIHLSLISGTLGSDVLSDVSISNPNFNGASVIKYWNGNTWVTVTTKFKAPDTVSGTIPASALFGTPILVGTPKSDDTALPLSDISLITVFAIVIAILVVLSLFLVYRKKRKAN